MGFYPKEKFSFMRLSFNEAERSHYFKPVVTRLLGSCSTCCGWSSSRCWCSPTMLTWGSPQYSPVKEHSYRHSISQTWHLEPMLSILTFWCGFGSRDPYLWQMDPDPYPTPDPSPFFSDFKDAKKLFFYLIFFLITHISSVLNLIFQKFGS